MKKEYRPERLNEHLGFLMYAASRRIVARYTPYLKPLGLTYTQYLVLVALSERDNVPVRELGARLCLDNGTLTPLLKKMEKSGLVTRVRSEDDERVVLVSLTEEGKRLRQEVEDVPGRVFEDISIEKKDAGVLLRLLRHALGI